eukprot:727222-Alexandrium_andersonii.AAC.1
MSVPSPVAHMQCTACGPRQLACVLSVAVAPLWLCRGAPSGGTLCGIARWDCVWLCRGAPSGGTLCGIARLCRGAPS